MPDTTNTVYNFMFNRMDGMISLRKGLDAFALRQKVQAANIANAETPNYEARRVSFESQLQKVLDRRSGRLVRTSDEHIPLHGGVKQMEHVQPQVYVDKTDPRSNGINNVDIDREMARMATNQIQFDTASKVMGVRFKMLKSAITGR